MATADQVKSLIKSHADGDDTRFYGVAMQVAAHAARNGHVRFAQELRDLVDRAKAKANELPINSLSRKSPVVLPRGELAGLLNASYPRTRLQDMVLNEVTRAHLDNVLLEQRQRDRLSEHGLYPIRKLLLLGPPGVGKTMSAAGLAGELALPLFSVELDGLITKFMGETAAKLRIVFDAIQQTRGVYLFDEFDALGSDRASKNDVGEIRRVLNSFLVLLEQDESESLVIAATNHPALLDHALFRRFDSVVEYSLPTTNAASMVMQARLAFLNSSEINWLSAAKAADGLSHADITRACERAAKTAILRHTTVVDMQVLLESLNERRTIHR